MKENEKSEKSFTGTRAPRAAPSKVLQNACFQKRVVVFKNLFRVPKLRFSKSRFPEIVSLVGYACSPCVLKFHTVAERSTPMFENFLTFFSNFFLTSG